MATAERQRGDSTDIAAHRDGSITIHRDSAGRAVNIIYYQNLSYALRSWQKAQETLSTAESNTQHGDTAATATNDVTTQAQEVKKEVSPNISVTQSVAIFLFAVFAYIMFVKLVNRVLPWIKKNLLQ
jgi:hypothetical protein